MPAPRTAPAPITFQPPTANGRTMPARPKLAPREPVFTGTPVSEILTITPDVAAHWLEAYNTHNRGLRERFVQALAADIAAGQWRLNGASISFDAGGVLLDGQHRLWAIVTADMAVPSLVTIGLSPNAQEIIDTGLRRSFSDVLHLRGESNTSKLAALVRAVYVWNAGGRGGGTNFQPTVPQQLRTLEECPELREHVKYGSRVTAVFKIPNSVAGLSVWLLRRIDQADADFFFDRIIDGANLAKNSPIARLRAAYTTHATSRTKTPPHVLLALTIKAWNAYRDGREVQILTWKSGGASPETFPEPK